jgi:hypothetical protein
MTHHALDALTVGIRPDNFREELLAFIISVQNTLLSSLFIVDDKVKSNLLIVNGDEDGVNDGPDVSHLNTKHDRSSPSLVWATAD